ncbi:hypothetical protein [Terriglobus albidus]|uniref:hypothetical protein n=1 Tax=Terriglobus albidus TaxID=1592106 RepID=UPI00164E0979|nr:hypothetical protein [Terriglobus albidus]
MRALSLLQGENYGFHGVLLVNIESARKTPATGGEKPAQPDWVSGHARKLHMGDIET